MSFFKVAAFLMVLFASSGCIQGYDYEYFLLGGEIEAVSYGKSDLEMLRNHKPMPTKYLLAREHYTLRAQVDTQSIPPGVIFSVDSKAFDGLRISGTPIQCFVAVEPIFPGAVTRFGHPEGGIKFVWKPATYNEPCSDEELIERVLELSITDKNGKLIATEIVPFQIKTNGTHYEIDTV